MHKTLLIGLGHHLPTILVVGDSKELDRITPLLVEGSKEMNVSITDGNSKDLAIFTRPNTCSCGAISYPEYANCVGEEEVLCPICGCVVLRVRLRAFRDEDTFDLPKKKRKFCTKCNDSGMLPNGRFCNKCGR